MKKKLIVILLFLMLGASLYAQQAGQSIFGFRIGYAWGLWSGFAPGESNLSMFDNNNELPFNFALYYAFAFRDNLSVQVELHVMEQGMEWRDGYYWWWWTIGMLDIPVLFRYNFFHGLLGFMAGPHFAFPIDPNDVLPSNAPSMTFGGTAVLQGIMPLGQRARLVGDLRLIVDFNRVANVRRQSLAISAGLEWLF